MVTRGTRRRGGGESAGGGGGGVVVVVAPRVVSGCDSGTVSGGAGNRGPDAGGGRSGIVGGGSEVGSSGSPETGAFQPGTSAKAAHTTTAETGARHRAAPSIQPVPTL